MMNSRKKMENLFVVGTDTGVGKTVLSLLLMQFFCSRGYNPFYLKPVQTGCKDPYDSESDAKFIYRHVGQCKDKDPADSVIYCFKNPKAPLFAARDEGKMIDLSVIENAVVEKARFFSPLIIEGAGGVLVPGGTNTLFVADLSLVTHAATGYCCAGGFRNNQPYSPHYRSPDRQTALNLWGSFLSMPVKRKHRWRW